MTFAVEAKERLPDWTYEAFERTRMNQLTQILERRFLVIEESLIEIQLTNQGTIGGDAFAPLVHTHGVTEIVDYPADNMTFSNFASDALLENLSNVTGGPLNNQVLKYSQAAFGGAGGWILDDFASAGNSLSSLTDTNISGGIVDGSILVYDLTSARWIDSDAASLPYVQTAGDLMSGSLIFGDSVTAAFGDASDATLQWNGSDFIQSIPNGNFRLRVAGGEEGIVITSNGAVTLYNNNIATLRTGTSTAEVWDGAAWQDVVLDTRTLDINGVANELAVDLAGPLDLSADRVWEIGLADDPVVPGVASMTIPVGTTAQAPTAANGMVRWDNDLDTLRFAEGITPTWRSAVWEGGAFHDGFSDFVGNEHIDHTLTLTVAGDANEITVAEGAQDITVSRTFNVGIADDPVVPGNASITIPVGTTAQEPSAVNGMFRYDSDTDFVRVVANAAWVNVQTGNEVSNAGIGEYTYEATASAPPASGEIRFDNLTIGSATNLYVHDTNADSVDVSNFLALLADGAVLFIQGRDNREKWVAVELSSATDNTTYWTFGIQAIDVGPTALADTDPVDFLFTLAGGAGGGTVDTVVGTTNEIVVDSSDAANPIVGIADDVVLPGNAAMTAPIGTTAQQPTAASGLMRYDSDIDAMFLAEGATPAWHRMVAHANTPSATGQGLFWFDTPLFIWSPSDTIRVDFAATMAISGTSTASVLQFKHTAHATLVGTIEVQGTNTTPMDISTEDAGRGVRIRTRNVAGTGYDVHLLTTSDEGIDFGYNDNIVLGTLAAGAYIDSAVAATDTDLQFLDNGTLVYNIFHDESASEIIHRMANAGDDFVIDDGTNVGARFIPNAGFQLSHANTVEISSKASGIIIANEIEIDGDLNHDGTSIGFYGTAPAAQSAAYTRNATAVEDRTLLASASATATNNNNVLAALIADLQNIGLLA